MADEKIAIVGGGIAGLFCALVLTQQKKSWRLFEASERLGGRIRTIRLDKNNKELSKDDWPKEKAKNLEFYAEFGPMRVELDKQLLLKALLTHLRIEPKRAEGAVGGPEYLTTFPAYASPASTYDPQYQLSPEEIGKTPLQLLRMALLRIIVDLKVEPTSAQPTPDFARQQAKLVNRITLAAATQRPVDPIFVEWMRELTPEHHWEIQTQGYVGAVPLYAIGFWNLLSDYLSHNAILKLRDLGTFYHLLPENPNAAEWLVWWLIGFGNIEPLYGVFGGMECIVDNIEKELNQTLLHPNCEVTGLETMSSGKIKLHLRPGHSLPPEVHNREYDRVVLALPKSALEKIVRQSRDAFAEPKMLDLLDAAFGFPMVKMFVVVKNRWWEEDHRANLYATRVPTRELHYWKGLTENSKQGLIMAYTDRPASSFWANYVPPGAQFDIHRSADIPPATTVERQLKKKVVQYINENEVPDITSEDIVWYGIRDWGREPYKGANHAWRPERKYWVVMRQLADLAAVDKGASVPSIHVCGEAYSDYHGFMEGSLRSAVYVLHRILDKKADGTFERLAWLRAGEPEVDGEELCVDKKYLKSLRKWADHLDTIGPGEPYLSEE